MNLGEQKIIDGLKHGDSWAYKHLYDCCYVLLCKIAYTFLKDDFLAQILVDDLIIHLYERRETLIINTSLRAYLVRSVRNRCINLLQSKYKRKEIPFSSLDTPDDWVFLIREQDDYPLVILLEKELDKEIRLAIKHLPVECRIVFEKSRYEGKNYETIAAELNISVNTVKYHIKNALLHLHKELKKYLLLILICLCFF
jgi:RNA polymerase sigma-70 factor (ECF subfamily)